MVVEDDEVEVVFGVGAPRSPEFAPLVALPSAGPVFFAAFLGTCLPIPPSHPLGTLMSGSVEHASTIVGFALAFGTCLPIPSSYPLGASTSGSVDPSSTSVDFVFVFCTCLPVPSSHPLRASTAGSAHPFSTMSPKRSSLSSASITIRRRAAGCSPPRGLGRVAVLGPDLLGRRPAGQVKEIDQCVYLFPDPLQEGH